MTRPPEYQQWSDRTPKALPWPPNPFWTLRGAAMTALTLSALGWLCFGCSSAMPLPTLPPEHACRVMATQPLWTVTDPDLVNLGDLKALVARLKACNAQPDGGV